MMVRGATQNRTGGVDGRAHLAEDRRADAAAIGARQEHPAVVGFRHGPRWPRQREPRG